MRTSHPASQAAIAQKDDQGGKSLVDQRKQALQLSSLSKLMLDSPRNSRLHAAATLMNDGATAQLSIIRNARVPKRDSRVAIKTIERLGATKWFKELSPEQQKHARQLHGESTPYPYKLAVEEIDRRIKDGVIVSDSQDSAKDERRKRVTAYINRTAPASNSNDYIYGKTLADASQAAVARMNRRYRKKKSLGFEKDLESINQVEPELFINQPPILYDRNPYQQMYSLTKAAPASYEYNLDDTKVKLDSIDVKSNDARSEKRTAKSIKLAQVFVEQQDKENSYWSKADSKKRFRTNPAHEKLMHLEVLRNAKSALTTYLKFLMVNEGKMSNEEAFGDEGRYAFMEPKGALAPSENMQRMQLSSAFHVLEKAVAAGTFSMGKQVGSRPMTTPLSIKGALETFQGDQTEQNRQALEKELFRLVRAATEIDVSSDESGDSSNEMSDDA